MAAVVVRGGGDDDGSVGVSVEVVSQWGGSGGVGGVGSSTSTSISQPSSDTKNNKISRTTSRNQKNKVEDYPRSVKSSLNKKNRVIVPVCNANVKHSILNANSELIYATCNGCLFDAIYDSYVLDFVNDVNARSKYKSSRSSKKKTTWKPTGKIFTTVGYKWIPTSRKFTIEGNRCPLTRTTSTNVVPPKNPLPLKVAKKTPTCRNNPEMRKDVTNKSSSSRSKGVVQIVLWYLDSGCSKHMTRNRSQLINFVHKFLGTVRFGNDQIAKIIGYGDYHMGNVTILGFTMWKGKSKKYTHKPKAEDSIQEKLYLLHMDLCGPMRIQSINGRKYMLVIVDDYSQFTWLKFLRSKYEVPEFVIKFLKMIQVRLNAIVQNIKTNNGTEFVNQTLRTYCHTPPRRKRKA
ncbi:retrovirus-related pol polyprotein from transposon TNT 1-94 [Tanacetum coccineum]